MIKDDFFITGGSVIGYNHRQSGRNNQDGFYVAANEHSLAAIVCDGCSSSQNSEVGAKMMARFIALEALRLLENKKSPDILYELRESALWFLRRMILVADSVPMVDDMFLFTALGAIVREQETVVFSLGDGVISLNGETLVIDEENTPSYLGYKVVPGSYKVDEQKINFVVRHKMPTSNLQTLIISTDGARDLIAKSEKMITVLGGEEKVGGLEQFETEERYLKNPSLLQKRLFQLNMERTVVDWEKQEIRKYEGMLSDDTTMILVRRR